MSVKCLQFCRWTVFKISVDELSCRWTVSIPQISPEMQLFTKETAESAAFVLTAVDNKLWNWNLCNPMCCDHASSASKQLAKRKRQWYIGNLKNNLEGTLTRHTFGVQIIPGGHFGQGRVMMTYMANVTLGYKIVLSQRRKKTWPDWDSNSGPLAYRASTLTTELASHTVDLWQFPTD